MRWMRSAAVGFAALVVVLPGAAGLRTLSSEEKKPMPQKERVFEMRTYTTHPGKLDALNARFRDHTNRLFLKHGMTLIAYWTPIDGERAKDTLVYVLAYPDRESRDRSWKAFQEDPDWKKARAKSEEDGALVAKVESVILKPTDYSPLR